LQAWHGAGLLADLEIKPRNKFPLMARRLIDEERGSNWLAAGRMWISCEKNEVTALASVMAHGDALSLFPRTLQSNTAYTRYDVKRNKTPSA
jgi:hypothetical protein